MLATIFRPFAAYNRIANQRLYQVCESLLPGRYYQQRGIHQTLNHILVGDRIWMARFTGTGGETTPPLDQLLYQGFEELREARVDEDVRIEGFIESLTNDFLDSAIRYVNNAGKLHEDPASLSLIHFFNHQTHHRGQVHAMLSAASIKPPSLDLHRIIRPHSISAAGSESPVSPAAQGQNRTFCQS